MLEATARPGRRCAQECAHAAGDRRVRGRRGVENERAVVGRAVAGDIASDERRIRRPRCEVPDGGELEAPGDGAGNGAEELVPTLEAAGRLLGHVWIG